MTKILRLPIKKQWLDMILRGEKQEEYREIKPYWIIRLMRFNEEMIDYELQDFAHEFFKKDNFKFQTVQDLMEYYGARFRNYDYIELRNGYGNSVPSVLLKFAGIEIKRGNESWGANRDFTFSLKIGEIVKPCG